MTDDTRPSGAAMDDPATDAATDGNAVWQRAEIESPCIKICVIHPEARLCTGCLRSIDEITQWSRMTPEGRSAVMAALPDRRKALSQRRGGRAARLARPPRLDGTTG